MNRKKINVLSLFDGISVGQLVLKELNIPVNNYYASEICKNAMKVTQHHFPGTIQLGDVKLIDDEVLESLEPIQLLIFGSPCQSLSIMNKNRKGLDSPDSGLFYEALRILQKVQPQFWIMENVFSMNKREKNIISKLLGVKPIAINSNLVGGANRSRLYWTNIPDVEVPTDREIILQSILEDGFVDRIKANAILTKNIPHTVNGLERYLTKSIGGIVFNHKEFAYLPKESKLDILMDHDNDSIKKMFRPFTTTELERLQTLPVGYVGDILKKTPSHHAIGNSFTNEVIKHIISYANFS